MRNDGRSNDQLRPIKFEIAYLKHHPGSVMVSMGNTKVLVVATSETRVPHHRLDAGGWLSAEYNMLPGSTVQRKPRAIAKLKNDGRSVEISRLIGRSLRQAVNLDALGQRSLLIDCDVIQADAGTRAASITGAYVAVCAHVASLLKNGQLKMKTMEDIIVRPVAAVSLGIVKDQVLLDLNYQEDVQADTDCNLVGSNGEQVIEFQCTAERTPMNKAHIDQIYALGQRALSEIIALQNKELLKQCGIMFHR
ncbi:MAG: ribonuclease PH [Myxococcales bacterium]|nr:ribonuclease PH [Myxococcales bacterium]USN49964.1 MAG: ribonuclease PH [Myxococcales bacterium]